MHCYRPLANSVATIIVQKPLAAAQQKQKHSNSADIRQGVIRLKNPSPDDFQNLVGIPCRRVYLC